MSLRDEGTVGKMSKKGTGEAGARVRVPPRSRVFVLRFRMSCGRRASYRSPKGERAPRRRETVAFSSEASWEGAPMQLHSSDKQIINIPLEGVFVPRIEALPLITHFQSHPGIDPYFMPENRIIVSKYNIEPLGLCDTFP